VRRRTSFNHPYGGEEPMKLNLPKKTTFWASLIIAVAGMVVGAVHQFANIPYLNFVAFLLVVAAFVLICLGLTLKGF
jgi:CHASE2 domain-containing sensor protein